MSTQQTLPNNQTSCPSCQSLNSTGQRFCGNCGELLESAQLASIIAERVKRELDERSKDQKLVEVEIAEAVYARLSKWAKIFLALVLLPLGAAFYLIYGQYTNLSDLIRNARTEAQRVLSKATEESLGIEATVKTASTKTQQLNASIDTGAKSLADLEKKVAVAQSEVAGFETKMSGYEARVSKSGNETLTQISGLKQDSSNALDEITKLREALTRQQQQLTETSSLLKDLASRSLLQGFGDDQKSTGDFATVTRTATSHALAMRLARIPYRETVRVQYYIAVQPPDAYFVIGNVVILPYWEDSTIKFAEKKIFVSYIADVNPSTGTTFYRKLSVKDKVIYGDDAVLLPDIPLRSH